MTDGIRTSLHIQYLRFKLSSDRQVAPEHNTDVGITEIVEAPPLIPFFLPHCRKISVLHNRTSTQTPIMAYTDLDTLCINTIRLLAVRPPPPPPPPSSYSDNTNTTRSMQHLKPILAIRVCRWGWRQWLMSCLLSGTPTSGVEGDVG